MIKDAQEHNESTIPNAYELDQIKEALPQYFDADGNFLIDKLQNLLKQEGVEITNESYELSFLGKSYARLLASLETETVLVPNEEHNNDPVNALSENIYITGDNLDALKHLARSYRNQVKCIYIDPPYNTGSDDFAYNDSFNFTIDDLVNQIGVSEQQAQRVLDLHGRASHSAWLTFMLPRLVLAKAVMAPEAVIFLSIDDNELANLKLLMEEIFGEDQFAATFIWEKRSNRENRKEVSYRHDYVLCYMKQATKARAISRLPMNEKALKNYKNPDNDPRGPWKSDPATAQAGHATQNQFYTVVAPNGKVHELPSGRCWAMPEYSMKTAIEEGRIWFGKDGNGVPRIKTYLHAKDRGLVPETIFSASEVGTNESAKNKLKDLFDGTAVFETTKPVELVKRMFQIGAEPDSLVMDFFSGSASTAHAVMALNAEDGGTRRYICVQIPEELPANHEARDAGYETVDDIGRDRIQRAADKIKQDTGADIDYGFKHFRLQTPDQDVLDSSDSFVPEAKLFDVDPLERFSFDGSTPQQALLTTWAVQDNYGLTPTFATTTLDTYELTTVGRHAYIIDQGLTSKDVITLIRLIEDNELDLTQIVYFNNALDFHVLTELKNALSQLSENKTVTLKARW